MIYGYARVSTQEQETNPQIDALNRAYCDVIFEEKRSGKNMQRPSLQKLLSQLQPGDTIVVYKLDRIARSLKDLLLILEKIEGIGASFKSFTEFIDTTSSAGRMIFQIIDAFSNFERELIRELTRVGMQAVIERDAKPGRPRGLTTDDETEAVKLWHSGEHTKTAIARKYRIHISSIKRAIARASLE